MLVSVVRRLPEINRATTCSASLLRRHYPDQLAIESAAPPQAYLSRLVDFVQEAQLANLRVGQRFQNPNRTANESGDMPCTSCGKYFPRDQFSKRQSLCKSCESASRLKYPRTLRRNATILVSAARKRSRAKGWHCSIHKDDIFEMLLEQEGRCHYSGVPMEIMFPNSHWRLSLERLNNSEGYWRQNCVLVAAEFNSSDFSRAPGVKEEDVESSAQWSAEKFRFVRNACKSVVDLEQLQQDVVDAFRRPFLSGMPSRASYQHAYYRTLRGRSKLLLQNARLRSKKRHQDCELDYTDILRALLHQQGRCFYSGVPLQYERPHTDWVMSLERLDNSLGYVTGNCVLIAAEFNTPDHSKCARGEIRGSSQWSLAKVMHVWGRAGFLMCDSGQGSLLQRRN